MRASVCAYDTRWHIAAARARNKKKETKLKDENRLETQMSFGKSGRCDFSAVVGKNWKYILHDNT